MSNDSGRGDHAAAATIDPATAEQQIRAIWAQLPELDCQGMCWDSCGPIDMTAPERTMIARHGVTIPVYDYRDGAALCPALTILNRCGVHDDRPTICRIWGLLDEGPLRCNYGCRPNGGGLSYQQAYLLIADVLEAAGDRDAADRLRLLWTGENAERSRQLLLKKNRQDSITRQRRMARAEENGTALYASGRGGLSKQPPGGKPK